MKEVLGYNHPNQLDKIKDSMYQDFRDMCKINSVSKDIFLNPSNYVYFLRCPNPKLIAKLKPVGKINIIYSQWDGYLKDPNKSYCSNYLNDLTHDPDIDFLHIHTSGHANLEELIALAKALKPSKIVPIHTDNPTMLKQEFGRAGISDVEIWKDNKEYFL